MNSEKYFILFNPAAGPSNLNDPHQLIKTKFENTGVEFSVYTTKKEDDLSAITKEAVQKGFTRVIAAGGDGTVSAAASALIDTDIPLGIIPLGTGNSLSKELEIAGITDKALDLILGEHRIKSLDTMLVDNQSYLLSIGVGITSEVMRDTERDTKQTIGFMAYLWNGARKLFSLKRRSFRITMDGQTVQESGIQASIVNAAIMGTDPFQWGDHIHLDDGQVDICVIRSESLSEHLNLIHKLTLKNYEAISNMAFYTAREEVIIDTDKPLPVQGDGENIGWTPVKMQLKPKSLLVITPAD